MARGKCWKPNCKACPNGQTQPEETTLTVDVQPGMRDDEEIVFSEVTPHTRTTAHRPKCRLPGAAAG